MGNKNLNNDKGPVRAFEITAYTGVKLQTRWGELIIDVSGMSAKDSMPVLREHERSRVVGSSEKYWKDQNNFFISGNMSRSTPDGIEVADLADEGFPWQASVGAWATKIETLEDENVTANVNGQVVKGPLDIWRESFVGEVSFVVLGADDQTAAVVMSRDSNGRATFVNKGQEMPEGSEKWKAEFAKSEELRKEFQGNVEVFLAFKLAESKGRVRICHGGMVS